MNLFKKIITNRIVYLIAGLVIVMGFVIYRLYVIQIEKGEQYQKEAGTYSSYELPIDAPRGNIYDRNGVLLATNRMAYKLYMVTTDDDQDFKNDMYLELISIMEKNGDVYYNYLEDYITYPIAWGTKLTDDENAYYVKKAWINNIVTTASDKDFFDTPENAFNYLRYKIFEIGDEYSELEAYRIMIFRYNWFMYGLDSLKPSCFATDVCENTINEITSKSTRFCGISFEKTYFRLYVNCESLGTIVGYVHSISEEEYKEKQDKGYFKTDLIGKLGVELLFEDDLRGTRGHRDYAKDADGNVYETGYTEPTAGVDIYLTIDAQIQQTTYESLKANIERVAGLQNNKDNFGDCDAGSAIVTDVDTGEILAMVTYPTFDNNLFVKSIYDDDAKAQVEALMENDNGISINRATMSAYPIGSMIKPVVAIAALEAGTTNTKRTINCPGYIVASGRRIKCLGIHNDQDLAGALARSCNVYFAQIGIDTGIDVLDKWIKAFGLGEYTGFELSEAKGTRSNPEMMDIREAGTFHKWSDASTAATSIGQLYTTFTPIQVNRCTAAIANGGYLYSTHVVKKLVSHDGAILYETPITAVKIDVKEENLKIVQNAMTGTISMYATLRSLMSSYPSKFIAGKTGTAQTGTNEQSSHAFYTCYLPASAPQISVTLLMEHGVQSINVFNTLKDVCDSYLGGTYTAGDDGRVNYYEKETDVIPWHSAMSIIHDRG